MALKKGKQVSPGKKKKRRLEVKKPLAANIKIAVRVRPENEQEQAGSIINVVDNTVIVQGKTHKMRDLMRETRNIKKQAKVKLRARVFHLATRMGPAAEAYSTTIDPAKPQPEKVESWRRVSADKLQKPLQLLNEAREVLDDAREELAYHRYKEQVLLNQLDESSQELAFLDLEREKVQSLKEQLVRLTQAKDLAVAQAHMAEHQADLNMQNFCLRFRNLKI